MTKEWKQAQQPQKAEQPPKAQQPERKKRAVWPRSVVLVLLLGVAAFLGLEQAGVWNRLRAGDSALQGLLEQRDGRQSPSDTDGPKTSQTLEGRSLRELTYQKDVEALEAVVKNMEAAPQLREDAAAQLARMVAAHQGELAIEEALKAAGFAPCLVVLQNGALTVMVEKSELTAPESAAILSLCAAHTDIGVENIRIMAGQ